MLAGLKRTDNNTVTSFDLHVVEVGALATCVKRERKKVNTRMSSCSVDTKYYPCQNCKAFS